MKVRTARHALVFAALPALVVAHGALAQTVRLQTGFEPPTFATGVVDAADDSPPTPGQGGWLVTASGGTHNAFTVITDAIARSGTQSLRVSPSSDRNTSFVNSAPFSYGPITATNGADKIVSFTWSSHSAAIAGPEVATGTHTTRLLDSTPFGFTPGTGPTAPVQVASVVVHDIRTRTGDAAPTFNALTVKDGTATRDTNRTVSDDAWHDYELTLNYLTSRYTLKLDGQPVTKAVSAGGATIASPFFAMDVGNGVLNQVELARAQPAARQEAVGWDDLTLSTRPAVAADVSYAWRLDTNGTWEEDGFWSAGRSPNGQALVATLGPGITADRVVTLANNRAITLDKLVLDEDDGGIGYRVSNTSTGNTRTFTFAGDDATSIHVLRGTHTLAVSIGTGKDPLIDVATDATLTLDDARVGDAADTLTKRGGGRLNMRRFRVAAVVIDEGSLRTTTSAIDGDACVTNGLQIAPGARLDLGLNRLAIDYGGDSPIEAIRADLAAGRIVTASAIGEAAVATNIAVGYVENSHYGAALLASPNDANDDVTLDADTLILRRTLRGDANLDLRVDFDDLLALAQAYDETVPDRHWSDGDSNYDGVVDFGDLLALAQNYGRIMSADGTDAPFDAPSSFESDWALARSVVPEPAIATLLIVAGIVRRRR